MRVAARPHDKAPHVPLECRPGEYDERVFLFFLEIERARARRFNRQLHLLLVTVEPEEQLARMHARTSSVVFAALKSALRETDVIGWYRQDFVAGVLLGQRSEAADPELSRTMLQRVDTLLRRHLPAAIAGSARVRAIEVGAGAGAEVGIA